MKKVAIIGSHGLYANYGGWDQLVNNLAERKSSQIEYLIFNSVDTSRDIVCPAGVEVRWLKLESSGLQGIFYDFWSILISYKKCDTLLLLGIQGIPVAAFLRLFRRFKIVSNVGGIEWARPKFGLFSKTYLKFCFKLAFMVSDCIILDNQHYEKFIPKRKNANVKTIPYGGTIDYSLEIVEEIVQKYPFIKGEYFLSVSRSLEDNKLLEICESFSDSNNKLVLISNFSKSKYGMHVYNSFKDKSNIFLINGLYIKPELDLIRRKCKAYIHTHTLCGTAPSLVEMIVAQRPILSIDIPQNRFTLFNQGLFFKEFAKLQETISNVDDYNKYIPSLETTYIYGWQNIVNHYESIF